MMNQHRVVIENVRPQLACGSYFIKRVVGDTVRVSSEILPDGHDIIQAEVLFKHEKDRKYSAVRMKHLGQDVYEASFTVEKQGYYEYRVQGWVDHALNWQHGITAKIKDGQHVKSELLDGVQYLTHLGGHLSDYEKTVVKQWSTEFEDPKYYKSAIVTAVSGNLEQMFLDHPQRQFPNSSTPLQVYVDRIKANFSTWYEFFPRSASSVPGNHGTFKDCMELLPRIANMGFDTLYFPPIHPIGELHRKGKNNATVAEEGDSGVPWAIGSKLGGHKAIHPQLGTEEDLKQLIKKAQSHGIEIALDLAFQAAPDHPYIAEHPEWFRKRPDGTIQYAENPPKKYQDIVNFNFENKAYTSLWEELLSVTLHWVKTGITIFRVDNPHTKPYYFWNWLITQVKKDHPDVLFLAEAFSRPKVMQQLAKQGFSQSYTYFTWREQKHEFVEYVRELTQSEMKEYYRPNFWPNTPDINPFHLQGANESMHLLRYALAAALSGNIGIYGPVFEYMVSDAMPGKEEYLHCEKYEIRQWDWSRENKLTYVISKINAIRKEHEALQQTNNIRFLHIDNPNLLAFYKWNDSKTDEMLIIISLDNHYTQRGNLQLPPEAIGFNPGQGVTVHDSITDNSYIWYPEWNYIELHPALPFHFFHIKK